jgi:hypothetical protein
LAPTFFTGFAGLWDTLPAIASLHAGRFHQRIM